MTGFLVLISPVDRLVGVGCYSTHPTVLSRQRYDWNWHCTALIGVFDAIYSMKHPSLKFGLIRSGPCFCWQLCWLLKGSAIHCAISDDQLAQCQWTALTSSPKPQPEQALAVARIRHQCLRRTTYQQIAAALTDIADTNHLAIGTHSKHQPGPSKPIMAERSSMIPIFSPMSLKVSHQ